MYCKNCGKFIGNDSDLCDECMMKEQVFSEFSEEKVENSTPDNYQEQPYTPQQTSGGSEVNLGKAIASTILSNIGFFMIYISFIIIGEVELSYGYTSSGSYGGAFVIMLIGIVPSILGLVFGIQSIINFKETAITKNPKRIPVLILGISSVVMAGTALFITFIMFFMLVALL